MGSTLLREFVQLPQLATQPAYSACSFITTTPVELPSLLGSPHNQQLARLITTAGLNFSDSMAPEMCTTNSAVVILHAGFPQQRVRPLVLPSGSMLSQQPATPPG